MIDGTENVALSYIDDCVYWYTSKSIGKWFVDTLRKRFHVNFLGFSHRFMSIRISNLKEHPISVYQARYYTSFVAKYLDTSTVKNSKNIYKTNFPSDIILNNDDVSTSDDQVEKLSRKFNINYGACIG